MRCLAKALGCAVFLAGVGWAPPSQAAAVQSTQRGTLTLPAAGAGSLSAVVDIQPVDPTKAVLFFSLRVASDDPSRGQVAGELLNAAQLRFARSEATVEVVLEWTVVEFLSGVFVQRGSLLTDLNSVATLAIPVDPAKSFALASCLVPDTDVRYSEDDWHQAWVQSATSLVLRHADTGTKECVWQVVEYDGASVQRGFGTLNASTALAAVPLAPAVDASRSMLLLTWRVETESGGRNLLRARLVNNGSTVEVLRDATGTFAEYAYELVSFNDGTRVVAGEVSFAGTDLLLTRPLPAVFPERSVAFLTGALRGGTTPYVALTNIVGPAWFTAKLAGSTTLELERAESLNAAANVTYQVVEFPPSRVLGEPCVGPGLCVSGFCVDGVCCDQACGAGDPSDCQACSVAGGAAVNGVCAPLSAAVVCRAAAGSCDAAERCDGVGPSCPPDTAAPDGTACASGRCTAGVCVAPGAPVIAAPRRVEARCGEPLQVSVSATGEGPIVFSLVDAPGGVTVEATGTHDALVLWSEPPAAAETQPLLVSATGPGGTATFTIQVEGSCSAPVRLGVGCTAAAGWESVAVLLAAVLLRRRPDTLGQWQSGSSNCCSA